MSNGINFTPSTGYPIASEPNRTPPAAAAARVDGAAASPPAQPGDRPDAGSPVAPPPASAKIETPAASPFPVLSATFSSKERLSELASHPAASAAVNLAREYSAIASHPAVSAAAYSTGAAVAAADGPAGWAAAGAMSTILRPAVAPAQLLKRSQENPDLAKPAFFATAGVLAASSAGKVAAAYKAGVAMQNGASTGQVLRAAVSAPPPGTSLAMRMALGSPAAVSAIAVGYVVAKALPDDVAVLADAAKQGFGQVRDAASAAISRLASDK